MTKYFHIVRVHPVENGDPNLYKVKAEREFDTKVEADQYIKEFNIVTEINDIDKQAVYHGRVNVITGELDEITQGAKHENVNQNNS